MSADPQRFAQVVLAAFEAAGLYSDSQVIAAGGPSTSTMTNLRKVADPDDPTTMNEPREPTWSKVDCAARWEPGSARVVWKGGDPKPFVGGPTHDSEYVASPGERRESGMADDEVLRAIRAVHDDVRALSERVAKLEEQRP